MTVRVRVDDAVCVGHGRCYTLAPSVYDADDRGHCVVVEPEIDLAAPGADELAGRACVGAEACPERAITVEDRGGPGAG